jgi:hypothetical protein
MAANRPAERRLAANLGPMNEERRLHWPTKWSADGDRVIPQVAAMAEVLASGIDIRAVVLVEGVSDRVALEALAERRGRDLGDEGVSIVAMGGATTVGHFLELLGPGGYGIKLAGLCDAAEEVHFQRGLERAGLGSNLTRADMELMGFYVCVIDLEDELIRSLGAATVLQLVKAEGELGSFRTYQRQPAHRGRSVEEQLWGFMHNRKINYARLLVGELDMSKVPRPLDRVLAHV